MVYCKILKYGLQTAYTLFYFLSDKTHCTFLLPSSFISPLLPPTPVVFLILFVLLSLFLFCFFQPREYFCPACLGLDEIETRGLMLDAPPLTTSVCSRIAIYNASKNKNNHGSANGSTNDSLSSASNGNIHPSSLSSPSSPDPNALSAEGSAFALVAEAAEAAAVAAAAEKRAARERAAEELAEAATVAANDSKAARDTLHEAVTRQRVAVGEAGAAAHRVSDAREVVRRLERVQAEAAAAAAAAQAARAAAAAAAAATKAAETAAATQAAAANTAGLGGNGEGVEVESEDERVGVNMAAEDGGVRRGATAISAVLRWEAEVRARAIGSGGSGGLVGGGQAGVGGVVKKRPRQPETHMGKSAAAAMLCQRVAAIQKRRKVVVRLRFW